MTAAEMASLHKASFPRGWSEAEVSALLAKPTTLATITQAGFALLQVIPPEAEVLTIIIDPALRGQRKSGPLLRQAVLAAQARGVTQLFLEVDANNAPALALYHSAGFTQTGRRKAYYAQADGTRSDAISMTFAIPTGVPHNLAASRPI